MADEMAKTGEAARWPGEAAPPPVVVAGEQALAEAARKAAASQDPRDPAAYLQMRRKKG